MNYIADKPKTPNNILILLIGIFLLASMKLVQHINQIDIFANYCNELFIAKKSLFDNMSAYKVLNASVETLASMDFYPISI